MKTVPILVVTLVPASLVLAIAFGSVDLGPGQLADALLGRGDEIAREIVWGVRAPRALAGFACGGLLALAGALLQVLLRNPLADPTSATGVVHGTQAVPNLTRITVQGSTNAPSEWLRLTVDPRAPDVFSWENVVYRP